MRNRYSSRKKVNNRFGMFLVTLVVCMLLVVVFVSSNSLKQKQEKYKAREAELQQAIAEEQERSLEIEEFEKYTKTKKYIEEVAREKLGLVYEDEIIFKTE